MQTGFLIFLLICASAVSGAPADAAAASPETTLGDKVFKKQRECENIINETIDKVLIKKADDGIQDVPTPHEDYFVCKETLNKMKRVYMSANQIETSTYPVFFPLTLSDGKLVMVSVPDEVGSERKKPEFDVNEELCVTSRKCKRVSVQKGKNLDDEKDVINKKFDHCSLLLNKIKRKYFEKKILNKKKIQDEGVMYVTCTEEIVLMPLPPKKNNLDSHDTHLDHLTIDLPINPPAENTSPAGPKPSEGHQETQTPTSGEGKHETPSESLKHVPTPTIKQVEGSDSKHVELPTNKQVEGSGIKLGGGSSNNAVAAKTNLVYCLIFIIVLVVVV